MAEAPGKADLKDIGDRHLPLVRNLSGFLSDKLGEVVEVNVGDTKVMRFKDYLATCQSPWLAYSFGLATLPGRAILDLGHPVAAAIMPDVAEHWLHNWPPGECEMPGEATGQRQFDVVASLVTSIEPVWLLDVHDVEVEAAVQQLRGGHVAAPEESVLVVTMPALWGERVEQVRVCYPLAVFADYRPEED